MLGTLTTFVDHVAGHAGVRSGTAMYASRAVVAGLGAYLSDTARQLLAEELPHPLAAALDEGDVALPIEEHVLAPGMTAGQAHELVACVCRVLCEELSTEAIEVVCRAVPADVAVLFTPSAPASPVPHEARRHATLASGRPGSEHAISDARSPGAQSASVGDPNPHADTKLSSTTGITQERVNDTLAAGEPGTDRPLSGR